jgi:lysophospholipid acyltransferase (LPLAT)-like uncharacterized protein
VLDGVARLLEVEREVKRVPGWLPPVAAGAIRALAATWRVRSRFDPSVDPHRRDRPSRCIYLLWHRTVLIAVPRYAGLNLCIGTSMHGDGELAARICDRFGFTSARGSSSRGGARLVRGMVEFFESQSGDLALTTDGPRGPLRKTKPGALFLASHLGIPVVPVGIAARPCKELRSWDRFMVPWPFARVGVVAASPLPIERDVSEERLAELCLDVDRRMGEVERAAGELIA